MQVPLAVRELQRVDPELRTAARFLPAGYSLHRGLAVPRAMMQLAGRVGRSRGVNVAAVNDDVGVRVHRASAPEGAGPALLWIHGGGLVMGTAAQEDKFCRKILHHTGVTVAAVDHRLAPEHPYPAPLEDCYAALMWLSRQPWVDPTRIAVGGASAGGGLAASLALLSRDRGDVTPALQMLVYPMLDDRTGTGSTQQPRVMWSARDNQLAWRWYLGDADPALAVPARREDLTGLPPAWIGIGTLDLFFEEALEYGHRLQDAGVPVLLESAEGAFHAFDLIAPRASLSQRFFRSQCAAVRAALIETSENSHA